MEKFNNLLEKFFVANPELLCIADIYGNFLKLNPAWEKILNYSIEELENKRFLDFVHPDDINVTQDIMAQLKQQKKVVNFINRYRGKDGSYKKIEWNAFPQGDIIIATARDVTDREIANKDMANQRDNLNIFFETIEDIVVVARTDGSIIHVNQAGVNKLGYTYQELKNMHLMDLRYEKDRKECSIYLSEIIKGYGNVCPYPMMKKDGSPLPAETRAKGGTWDGKECFFIIVKDLTVLKEALDKFQSIFDNNPALMAVTNIKEGRISDVNISFVKTLGYKKEEVVGKTEEELDFLMDKDVLRDLGKILGSQGQVSDIEIRVRKKNGDILYGLFAGLVIETQEQRILLTVISDITDLKKTQEQFQEAKANMRAILDNLPYSAWLKDMDGKYLDVNKEFMSNTGKERDDIIGFDTYHVWPYDRAEKFIKEDNELIEKGEKQYIESKWGEQWFESFKAPIFNEKGKVVGSTGIQKDITQRKTIERELRSSEEKLRLLFENMTNCFSLNEILLNDEGEAIDYRILMVNDAYLKYLGLKDKEVIGRTKLEINPFADKQMIKKYGQVALKGLPMRQEYLSKETGRFLREFSYSTQRGLFALGFEDITNKKETEDALKEVQMRFDLATSSASIGLWDIKIPTGDVFFNEEWAKVIGYSLSEIQPVSTKTWIDAIHPEDLEIHREKFMKCISKETVFYECESRMKHKNGHWVWVLDRGKVVGWDEEGKPTRMVGTHMDISHQKENEAELISSKEQAEAASIAKSQFIANMSHEIRTPMNGIAGFLQLLENTSLNEVQQEYLNTIRVSTNILLGVINDILDLSKIDAQRLSLESIKFDLHEAIEDSVVAYVASANDKNVEMNLFIEPGTPESAIGDPVRLKQIVSNLVCNAVKFTEEGSVEIQVKHSGTIDGRIQISIEVMDSGIGISDYAQKELFEPFKQADSSTTRKYGGTGLGLSIAKSIAEAMDGNIKLESREGKGSTFTVTVFLEEDKDSINETLYSGLYGKRILLVDTGITVKNIIKEYLHEVGAIVDSLSSGAEAISAILENKGDVKWDAMLVGQNLGDMKAYELLAVTKAIPSTKNLSLCLIASLVTEDEYEKFKQKDFSAILKKPFRKRELLNTLMAITNKKGPLEVDVKTGKEQALEGFAETSKDLNLLAPENDENASTKRDLQRILAIDDSLLNLKLLLEALKDDYEIFTATNGIDGIAIAGSENPPDLILLDIMMPDMNGYEVFAKLNENPNTKDIPVIFVTAMQDEQSEEYGLKLGAMDYIRKPYNIQTVKAKVKNHLELKQHKDLLKQNSLVDELTKIANRRKFNDTMEVEIRRAKRTGGNLSVLMIDIDHFKDYNDTYGHLEGDICLKKVARVLKESINRPGDLIARWGGEEFVVLLLDTDREGTAFVAEKLRKSVEDLGIIHPASPVSGVVTISVGGAYSNPGDISSYDRLVMQSDKALYSAKRSGRNQIKVD